MCSYGRGPLLGASHGRVPAVVHFLWKQRGCVAGSGPISILGEAVGDEALRPR